MSISFYPHYISFKRNDLKVKMDNLTIHDNLNTKWVRFCGTPLTNSILVRDRTHIT